MFRYVLKSDYEHLDAEIRDEESDGPIELHLDDGRCLTIVPDTERMSINVGDERLPVFGDSYTPLEPAGNGFWMPRVNRTVLAVSILQSRFSSDTFPSEFGLMFALDNGCAVLFEYVSDEEHTDMLRVQREYSGPPVETVSVAGG